MSVDAPEPRTRLPPGAVSSPARRTLRNGLFNLMAQGLYAAIYVVVVCTLARGLGKEVLGEYYTLFALILVIQLVVEAGVGTVLTCRIARSPEVWRQTVAEAAGLFVVIVLVSAAVFLGMGGVWVWLRGDPAIWPRFVAAGLACAAIQVQRFCAGVFQAFEIFYYENLSKILQMTVFAALVLGLVGRGIIGLGGVLAMLAASHAIAALFLVGSLQRRWRCLAWRLSLPLMKDWLSEAAPLGSGDVFRGLTWQLDTILLGLLQPYAVVGIYSVAYRPLGPLNWLPRAILTAAFPSFARMAEEDRDALGRTFSTSLRLLWITSIPIAVAIFVFAEPLIVILAGREYLEATLPMRVLIWITVLSFLSFQFRFLFAAMGRSRAYVHLVILILVLEAGIEAALIPWWGYLGACAGSMFGELVFTMAGLAICRRWGIGRIEWGALVCAVLAGAAMGAVLWATRGFSLPMLVPTVMMATGLYFLLCILLGALCRDEVQRLYQALIDFFRSAI